MQGYEAIAPLEELGPYDRYRGTFPEGHIPEDEDVILEWRPSKVLWGKGHPLLGIMMFPGAFTLPFTLLIPVLAFLGVLSFFLNHFYEIGLALIALLAILVYGSGLLAWKMTFLAVTDRAVYVRTGILFKRVSRAEFQDIEGIKVRRTLFERFTGRGTLHFILREKGPFGNRKLRWTTINHPLEVKDSLEKLISPENGKVPHLLK